MTTFTYDTNLFSDLHKEAYGFRPSSTWWAWFNEATDDELQHEWDSLIAAMDDRVRANKEIEAKCEAEFKTTLTKLAAIAGSEDTAIRWLVEEEINGLDDWMHDRAVEEWVYGLGILYTEFGKSLVERGKAIVAKAH